MKNLIAKLIFAGLILFFALVNFSIHERTVNPDISLSMKNTEALANGESGGTIYCIDYYDCRYYPFDVCVYCGGDCYSYQYDLNEYGNSIGSC